MIPETKIPGSYNDPNYYGGKNGLPKNVLKLAVVGAGISSGSLAVNTPQSVDSEDEAISYAGAGSVLHRMYLAAKAAWNYAVITLVRHAEPADGTAAQWTLTFATTATKSGKIAYRIGSDTVTVYVSVGDTPAAKAAKMAAAINAKTALPVTAVAAEGVCTLTAKNVGEYISGSLTFKVLVTDTDMTAAHALTVAGTGDVDLTVALAAMFGARYHLIAIDVSDAANIALLKTHLDNAADAIRQRGQRGLVGFCGAKADVTALGPGINSERISVGATKTGYAAPVWEIAAGMASIYASNSKPNLPMNFEPIPGLPVPDVQDIWEDGAGGEQDTLLDAGIIPLVPVDGVLCIVRAITTRTLKDGVAFEKLIDTGIIAAFDYFRDCMIARDKADFSKSVLFDNGQTSLRDAIKLAHYDVAKQLEKENLTRNVDDHKDEFTCDESTVAVGRVLCHSPATIVPGLIQIYTTIDLII
ncbi:MAG: phage tail sheath subtilisin-like domain-containing protein [Sphaerochaetaceae bacterium]